jgi:antitoxin CptB
MVEDELSNRRRKLLHRSRYRGFLEADLVFGRFTAAHLDRLSEAQLDRYEQLLREDDHDLWAWITGCRPVPARHDNDVMGMLQRLDYVRETTGRA